MDDLISRAAAIAEVEQWAEHGYDTIHWTGIKAMLEVQPAVDAAPVVHGRWLEVDEGDGDYTYDCSVCGGKWWLVEDTPEANGMKYCPYCGAKMDGGEP